MTQILTKEIAYSKLQAFFNDKPMVFFGTEISCAVDERFEIPTLEDYNDQERIQLMTQITAEYGIKFLKGEIKWPAIELFKRLVKGLPETDRKLHVATPNYDLLAEYAFEQAKIPYLTGFLGGICRLLDWKQCERAVTYVEPVPKGNKIRKITKLKKHVRLYKLHGSLNTFKLNDDIVENNAWINNVPAGVERMMLTQGNSKVEWLHQNRDLLDTFYNAVRDHSSFLFLGFEFNDSQLNKTLEAKLKNQKTPGLIIIRDSNESVEELLNECDNLWLVCKQDNNSTKIYNKQYEKGLYLEDKEIWKIENFTREILGV